MLTFIFGGSASGKSEYAEQYAASLAHNCNAMGMLISGKKHMVYRMSFGFHSNFGIGILEYIPNAMQKERNKLT